MNVKCLDFYPKVGGGLSTKCIRFFLKGFPVMWVCAKLGLQPVWFYLLICH